MYCRGPAASGTLEVYGPSNTPARAVPVVMWLHGGGWVLGDGLVDPGTLIDQLEHATVDHGWLFVSVNYGLAPAHRWPAQIADAKCAVRYLRANAGSLHVDPAHIGVIGASAGGQLAALVGLARPSAGFDVGQYLDEPSTVQAVVDEYGPADLNDPSWSATPLAEHVSPEVFGVPAQPASATLAGASPVSYVSGAAPPFLVVQGAEDEIVAPGQSQALVQRLDAAGAAATLVMVKNAGHGLEPADRGPMTPSASTVAHDEERFLFDHLG
jgi:acetyl esterase/lipase